MYSLSVMDGSQMFSATNTMQVILVAGNDYSVTVLV
jgi:hypothetical protein